MIQEYSKRGILLVILCSLFGLLGYALFSTHDRPSVLTNQPVPAFELTNLLDPPRAFSEKDLTGRVSLLNVWATWCDACHIEHDMLMKISAAYHVPIYSIVYKDKPSDILKWLKEKGNPYVMVGNDENGNAAIDLGIYGTPETFIINAQGKIVYRHIGVLDQTVWDRILYPIIKRL